MKKVLLFLVASLNLNLSFSQEISGPVGSGKFGNKVHVLSNGNFVVIDPLFDDGVVSDVGAVYLFDGSTKTIISTLKGSTASDKVGSDGIFELKNSNFIIHSPYWDNGAQSDAGAVTWISGTSGLNASVNSSNSLVGKSANDKIGIRKKAHIINAFEESGIFIFSNGNYIVSSTLYDDNGIFDVGAVTYSNAATGITGEVSDLNSLLGSTTDDWSGYMVTELTNGNFVVGSPMINLDGKADCGAVTWCDGGSALSGRITMSNSLYADRSGSQAGIDIHALTNGNYVVCSYQWLNSTGTKVGAATWGNGTSGITGLISVSNSLIGSTLYDNIGFEFTALKNGNYVVGSRFYNNGTIVDAGMLAWGDGNTGLAGIVSTSNSLLGTQTSEKLGRAYPLQNGNYLVLNWGYDLGALTDAGAIKLADGTIPNTGNFDTINALMGSYASDMIGFGSVYSIGNGNYVISNAGWNSGRGAATWFNENSFVTGRISALNSLVGNVAGDRLGDDATHLKGVVVLTNGNYVVTCHKCDIGLPPNTYADAGAVTWCNGATGLTGNVSYLNSLISNYTNCQTGGAYGVMALSNGNYVVQTNGWSINGSSKYRIGAITWGDGLTGVSGVISATNSLIGTTSFDNLSLYSDKALSNGDYLIGTRTYDSGGITDVGALTYGNGTSAIIGEVNACNSIIGTATDDDAATAFDFNAIFDYVIVGQDTLNKIVIRDRTDFVSGAANVSIALTSGNNPSCAPNTLTFTATTSNLGTSPVLQWNVNGVGIPGEDGQTFTSSTLVNTDIVSLDISVNGTACSAASTISSNQITISFGSASAPTVTISSDDVDNTICSGDAVNFTAAISNLTAPITQTWKVNNVSVGSDPTYSTSTLSNSDQVICEVNGTDLCATTASVVSNTITTTVNAIPQPVLPAFTEMCDTASVLVLTQGTPAGGTYQVNGLAATSFDPATATIGTNTITYSVTENGCTGTTSSSIDVIECDTTSSIDELSNSIQIYPNPTNGVIVVKGIGENELISIQLLDAVGKVVATFTTSHFNIEKYASGMYQLKITSNTGQTVQKIQLIR